MTTLTRVASVALLTSSLAGPVYASNVSAPTGSQAPQTSASTAGQNATAPSIPHVENAATSKTASSASTQSTPPAVGKNTHTENAPSAKQTATPQQNAPASTQSAPPVVNKNTHTESAPTAAQTATPQQNAPASTQNAPPVVNKNTHTESAQTAAQTASPQQNAETGKNAHVEGNSPSEENAQSSHTAAAAAAANSQNTTPPQAPPVVDTQSFTNAGIPTNDEKSWVGIGVRDGHTAASLNHIFEQTVSNPHHKETDNPEFFNNIHPIVDALNDHKFTLGDLSTLIAEHHHQEEEGKAEELGPDLTNIIIDSAAKIHHGESAQETVGEITVQQHAIDEAEKKEQND